MGTQTDPVFIRRKNRGHGRGGLTGTRYLNLEDSSSSFGYFRLTIWETNLFLCITMLGRTPQESG